MAIRIEVYQDEELCGELEFEDRDELASAKGLGERILKKVPFTDEEVDAMSPAEKMKYIKDLQADVAGEDETP